MEPLKREGLLLAPRDIARECGQTLTQVVQWIEAGYPGRPDIRLTAARIGPDGGYRVRPRDFDRFFIAVSRLPEEGVRRAG